MLTVAQRFFLLSDGNLKLFKVQYITNTKPPSCHDNTHASLVFLAESPKVLVLMTFCQGTSLDNS